MSLLDSICNDSWTIINEYLLIMSPLHIQYLSTLKTLSKISPDMKSKIKIFKKQIKVCGKCTLNREKIPELCDQLTFIDMRKRIVSEKEINQKINLWEFFSALKN